MRPGPHRQASSMALMQQKLAEMGSYAKYYKAITQNSFQVRIRCVWAIAQYGLDVFVHVLRDGH